MKNTQTWLAVTIFLICAPAFADNAKDSFQPAAFRDCPDCPEMVVIPAGSFDMGSNYTSDPFQGIVAAYLAANPKPQLSEEAHKFKVQAELAAQEKQFGKAVELYGNALEIAPWWPEGHHNNALLLGEMNTYRDAISEMKLYLLLVPDAPDARAAREKIDQWESVTGQEPESGHDEKPIHRVTIGRAFALGKIEVTQAQWRAIMGNNYSKFTSCGDSCPVENINWNEVQEYIQKLNAKTGKRYRLPSEAEWEYACRAGGQQEYCGSDNVDSVAWYGAYALPEGNSGGTSHPAATKQANAWGLYDMSGNVWEWVEDSWHTNYIGAPADGSAWQGDGVKRVLRGGSWYVASQYTRAANRDGFEAARRTCYSIGFRLAMTLP